MPRDARCNTVFEKSTETSNLSNQKNARRQTRRQTFTGFSGQPCMSRRCFIHGSVFRYFKVAGRVLQVPMSLYCKSAPLRSLSGTMRRCAPESCYHFSGHPRRTLSLVQLSVIACVKNVVAMFCGLVSPSELLNCSV